MTVAQQIENKVNLISDGTVFSIEDLGLPAEWWENIRVKLSRMVSKGLIQKLSKGRFYKPKKSVFGTMKPNLQEIVKDLIYDKDGKPIGYLTGYSIWNDMALTTQVASVIMLGTNKRHNATKRGIYSIRFVHQPNAITKDNIYLLQILDTIKFIKKIPDTGIARSITALKSSIGQLPENDIKKIIRLSDKYQPRVKAILGAILDDLGYGSHTIVLRDALNPGTKYKIGLGNATELLNKDKWNIE